MRRRGGSGLAGVLSLAFVLFVAGCGDGTSAQADGGSDAGADAGGDGAQCLGLGEPCAGPADCCSLACDLTLHVCVEGACGLAGATCTVPTDCCSLNCVGGICTDATCLSLGAACSQSSECCTANCDQGTCQPIVPGGCLTLGNACTAASECCSLNCLAGRCAPSFVCANIGEICYTATDCCTGVCNIPEGLTAGTCGTIEVTGAGGCLVAGLPCTDLTQCCSRMCVPTSTGISVCQVTSGCRLQGELCTETSDCCPGPEQSSQYGLMECGIMEGTDPPIGRCRNPTGCNPVGNVCKGEGVNAPADCCDCLPPKFQCCHPDGSGVWRCAGGSSGPCPRGYDGTPGCCIPAGGQCSFSSECCEGRPCVPDDQGVLRCGATQCVPAGGVCTSTTDCCAGLTCVIEPGQSTGVCMGETPTTDGGVPDGGVCALPGQHCTTSADCCYGYTCYAPGGTRECTAQDTGCTCYTID